MERNPEVLEQFVIDCIPLDKIKIWLTKKQKKIKQDQSIEDNLDDEIVLIFKYEQIYSNLFL